MVSTLYDQKIKVMKESSTSSTSPTATPKITARPQAIFGADNGHGRRRSTDPLKQERAGEDTPTSELYLRLTVQVVRMNGLRSSSREQFERSFSNRFDFEPAICARGCGSRPGAWRASGRESWVLRGRGSGPNNHAPRRIGPAGMT